MPPPPEPVAPPPEPVVAAAPAPEPVVEEVPAPEKPADPPPAAEDTAAIAPQLPAEPQPEPGQRPEIKEEPVPELPASFRTPRLTEPENPPSAAEEPPPSLGLRKVEAPPVEDPREALPEPAPAPSAMSEAPAELDEPMWSAPDEVPPPDIGLGDVLDEHSSSQGLSVTRHVAPLLGVGLMQVEDLPRHNRMMRKRKLALLGIAAFLIFDLVFALWFFRNNISEWWQSRAARRHAAPAQSAAASTPVPAPAERKPEDPKIAAQPEPPKKNGEKPQEPKPAPEPAAEPRKEPEKVVAANTESAAAGPGLLTLRPGASPSQPVPVAVPIPAMPTPTLTIPASAPAVPVPAPAAPVSTPEPPKPEPTPAPAPAPTPAPVPLPSDPPKSEKPVEIADKPPLPKKKDGDTKEREPAPLIPLLPMPGSSPQTTLPFPGDKAEEVFVSGKSSTLEVPTMNVPTNVSVNVPPPPPPPPVTASVPAPEPQLPKEADLPVKTDTPATAPAELKITEHGITTAARPSFNSLKSFLAASSWKERLRFSQKPDTLDEVMERYYRNHADGPVPVDRIDFVERYPARDGAPPYCMFELRGGAVKEPLLVLVQETPKSVPRVDWEAFVEFKDHLLWDFLNKPSSPAQKFRVMLRRKHTFERDVPDREHKDSFELSQPNADATALVYAPRDGKAARLLAQHLSWNASVAVIIELAWRTDGTRRWVEIQAVPAFGWRG